jgi:hypothetical protein
MCLGLWKCLTLLVCPHPRRRNRNWISTPGVWRNVWLLLQLTSGETVHQPRPPNDAMARKSKHEDEFGSRGVEFAMANWDMQRTQSYVERGRQFENATDEDLQALFVQAFRDWRADPWGDGDAGDRN